MRGWELGEWPAILPHDSDSEDDLDSDERKWKKYLESMAPFVSNEMMTDSISPSSSPSRRWPKARVRKTWQFVKELCRQIESLALESQQVALSHREWRTKLSRQVEDSETSSNME